MKILFIADGRSAIAQGWISQFMDGGYEAHLISTFPCDPPLKLASLHVVSAAFSAVRKKGTGVGRAPGGARAIGVRSMLRHWLGPLTIRRAARAAQAILDKVSPDILHALRIPYEGMLAAELKTSVPMVLSVWGNDFTLHAPTSPGMRTYTRRTVMTADALITDCRRDFRLACEWGYSEQGPFVVLPGGGGVDRTIFNSDSTAMQGIRSEIRELLQSAHPDQPVIVNPRGFRAYIRNDTFFRSIPYILERAPEAVFLCPSMAGETLAEDWVDELGIRKQVHLLPILSKTEMAAVYRSAWVCVSPSEHDGTPNTFLEAIACGAFPVVGNIESLREWVTDDENGFLINPQDPLSLGNAVCNALDDNALRQSASAINQELVDTRASSRVVRFEGRKFMEGVRDSVG